MAGTVMIILDFFVVNVALPSMQKDLHTSSSGLEWVVAGYGLTFAALLVTAGRLGDRCGRRLTLCAGLALFGAASFVCGVAPSASVLIAARLAQGAAAALISTSVLALMGVLYTGTERVRAISIYGMTMGLAAAAGQLIGGVILQANLFGLGWRSLFLINIPIAVVALLVAPRLVPESRAERPPAFDVVGVVLVTAGLVALVLPLVQGRQLGWPAWTWVCLAGAPAVFAVFVAHQRRLERAGGSPVLPPSLFANRSLRAGLLTQLAFWSGQAALFLVLALYLQDGRHLDPLQAGMVFSILAASYLATSLRAPALTVRHGREVIALGAVLLAAGDGILAATDAFGGFFAVLVIGLLIAGAGMGLCVTPLTSIVLGHTDPERAGAVSGALSTMQQVGNSLGVAVTGAIFFGAASTGVAHAFELSALELACLLAGVALLTRLLPRPAAVR
jgi:EmrB/QacA subfamily drug resistance transporter